MYTSVRMTHQEHVSLIEKGVVKGSGGVWADFGSGEGAFTLALADLLGEEAKIYSIDKETHSLEAQRKQFERQFPRTNIQYKTADFTLPLELEPLDGIIAANSLHFHVDKMKLFRIFASYIKPGGTLIVVEYNVNTGNYYVPYPFDFTHFTRFAVGSGFTSAQLLATKPSLFLKEMYAAKAIKKNSDRNSQF